jgi:hypothetical protein
MGLAVGVLRGVTHWVSGRVVDLSAEVLLLAPLYVSSMVGAGLVAGLLWPLVRWSIGRVALALLVGAVFFLGPLIWLYGTPIRWGDHEWLVYGMCSVLLAGIVWYAVIRPEAPVI